MPRPRTVALACIALAALFGFYVSGGTLYRAAIGLDPVAFPAGEWMESIGKALLPGLGLTLAGVILAIGSLLLVAVLTFLGVTSSVRSARGREGPDAGRRSLLTGTLTGAGAGLAALVVGGGGLFARAFRGVGNEGRGWSPVLTEIFGAEVTKTHPDWKGDWKGSRVRKYRRLGRTEWQVSDIVMGTGPLRGEKGEQIVRLGLQRGVSYIDTSPDYSASGSEQIVGRGIRGTDRGKLFLATKFCTPRGHLPPGTPVEVYRQNVSESLKRLGTDYVDLIHVHSCDEIDRLLDPNMHEAFRQLKAEGQARFLGFSTHTPNLEQVVNASIDSGKFDVMMLAYHHGIWSKLGDLIERARREQDMGVVAMKTLKGAKHHGLKGFREEAGAYSQAALKWALSNPDISCAVISFSELQHVDEYLYASGAQITSRDHAVLQKYDREILGTYCAPHCGACLGSCPERVPIHDVLRHRMYFEDYGSEKEAMRLYAQLERNASACLGCSAPCMGSCPVGIPIQERTIEAHRMLRLG
jgi:predicted aldo/keto reductase-like oxidoreductase